MCWETTFTSLLLILFCVGILEEEKTVCTVISAVRGNWKIPVLSLTFSHINEVVMKGSVKSLHRKQFVLVSWPEAPLGDQQTWCTLKLSPRDLFYIPAEEKENMLWLFAISNINYRGTYLPKEIS